MMSLPALAPAVNPCGVMGRQEAKKQRPNKAQVNKVATAEIKLKAFDPKAAYLDAIKATDKSQWLTTYYAQQVTYRTQPMFYVDVAGLFHKNAMPQQAMIILSNILELDFENSEFLRVFALKAMEFGEYKLAIKAFEKVKELRPFEPQSFRDLALAHAKNNAYQSAADNFYHILTHTWDGRFSGLKIVVINELNALLARHKTIKREQFDTRLINTMPVDLRIVINWSSDNTDIDLWVIDPYGEKTFYSNKVSRIGGKISNDITRGYGPEEFMIKQAVTGTYKIQANYYGNSQQKQAIPVTIRAEIYSNFAKVNQEQKELVLRLNNKEAVIDIGEFSYDAK